MILEDNSVERLRNMSASRLTVRFSDFKWSDKIAMRDFEAKDPTRFRKEIIHFVSKSTAETETESYRLQMLGEFVGWMLPGDSLSLLKQELEKHAGLEHHGGKQFEQGLGIGEKSRTKKNVANVQRMRPEVVRPD